MSDDGRCVYRFRISAAGHEVMSRTRDGRAGCPQSPGGQAMKRALVTGGSGAIGAAICRRLAQDGCHVYVHANRNLPQAERVRRRYRRRRRPCVTPSPST